MASTTVIFAATGDIQTYVIPATGGYLIEACGAQAPAGPHFATGGDVVKGMFYLNRGDTLKIVVGSREPSPFLTRRMTCAGEGGTVVWRGVGDLPLPAKLLLAAGGGRRPEETSDPTVAGWGASFNAGAFQVNTPGTHTGDGLVSITSLPGYPTPPPADSHDPFATHSRASASATNV